MVHTRINERAPNPNHFINFISSLQKDDQDAVELLRSLAAQVKPVMKNHGFTVNSLEEYEPNSVFLGRNWNNGETIGWLLQFLFAVGTEWHHTELVLKDHSGQYYPTTRLLSVFCHELAHIKHMNHSAAFHSLRRQLTLEVFALQHRGYFGDGYWSAGTRLVDSRRMTTSFTTAQELPAYTCGGAYTQSRQSALRSRKRQRRIAGPSLNTGPQTSKRRKAGSRVTSKTAFSGGGTTLDPGVEKGATGSGFGRRAVSQRAREERAAAAERRLKASPFDAMSKTGRSDDEAYSGSDYELIERETDQQRLERMRRLMNNELELLRDDDLPTDGIEVAKSSVST